MKKLITLIIIAFAIGCKQGQKTKPVIVSKSYRTYNGSPMQSCICRFFYKEYSNQIEYSQFEDSCQKYNVGDTIIGLKK